jgi:hypothetical protein
MERLVGVPISRARILATAATVSAVALIGAPNALADTTSSTNWAGYAVHGNAFRNVQATWRQPGARCRRGASTYSSYWVGIGGYSQASRALDQIGTEIDCTASGRVRSSAWYELVPAGAVELRLRVRPGDLMQGAVSVTGARVSVLLYDVTRKRGFLKTLVASMVDTASAEWIVEVPSQCLGPDACQTLLLANFRRVAFSEAAATTSSGHAGGINDAGWQTTRIKLVPVGRRAFVRNGESTWIGAATPSAVGPDNRSFKVSYSGGPGRWQAARGWGRAARRRSG